MNDGWTVDALKYAEVDRPASDLFGDPAAAGTLRMDFFVWVLRRQGDVVVIDCGFDRAVAARRRRTITCAVEDGLAAIGVDHRSVRDVVISHLHYDHAGNTSLFPGARFWVQRAEYVFATTATQTELAPYEADDAAAMVRRRFEGRVELLDGLHVLRQGVRLVPLPGHSPGSQAVVVDTASGPLVLAADAAHYRANIEARRAYSVSWDAAAAVQRFDELLDLAAGDPARIVPGHDPDVFDRFAAPDGAVAGRVVRLAGPLAAA